MHRPDPDIEAKVQSTIRSLNETIQCNANEPSLALYRIQVNDSKYLLTICYFKQNPNLRNMYKRVCPK